MSKFKLTNYIGNQSTTKEFFFPVIEDLSTGEIYQFCYSDPGLMKIVPSNLQFVNSNRAVPSFSCIIEGELKQDPGYDKGLYIVQKNPA